MNSLQADHDLNSMNRSSSRKVKLTSKFEEFKLTANGKKRGRPRKSWPQDEQPSPPDVKMSPHPSREESLRPREENTQVLQAPAPAPPPPVTPVAKTPSAKPMSSKREELLRLREENANLKSQFEQLTGEHEELKRQTSYTGQTVPKIDYDDLKERYQRDITYAKRHEWCVVCLNPSKYYCCWNTTYCSQKCQVSDWYARHGKSCERRKAYRAA